MNQRTVDMLATWFYSGKFSKMPGTMGTLAAVPFAFAFAYVDEVFLALMALFISAVGLPICRFYQDVHQVEDAKEIVIDEVAGYLIAVTLLPFTWLSFLLAFLLFRFFDILKPFPISYVDKNMKGAMGVMLDDILAGFVTNVILQLFFFGPFFSGLSLYEFFVAG